MKSDFDAKPLNIRKPANPSQEGWEFLLRVAVEINLSRLTLD